ncbi:actin cytoskeleton-regulatory complex protein END3 [Candidozyma auris]|nr:actin cytoskeleton-regulatory complex protein END3 [[Candida] auris]QEL58756.1 actin cytoskeleton-regulatory complex protein END3 [[Candida] auris]
MPRLEEWEIKKYWEIFQGLKPENNKLTGDRVSPVLKNSRLKDDQLSKIWDLSDIDADGRLDFEEFCITMRLIFDLVNGSMSEVPSELPGWLIPSSKAHLIHANRAVATGSTGNSSFEGDDDDNLSDDFDWYISPTDKGTYETIYNSNSDSYGRVRFDSLEGLYQTLTKVPRSDISSAWNLVNPKSFETIDKDQVLVFLHILNQRENGKRIPRGVPASLRATFSKEVPTYDLSAAAASTPSREISEPKAHDKKSFGTSYLNKIGQANNTDREKGTDFSATEGTDWEEVRLRRELANLEDLLEKAKQESKSGGKSSDNITSDSALLKHEFEQLLKYKQNKLNAAQSVPNSDKDLTDVKNDIELIGSQVQVLEEFLAGKENELAKLQQELSSLT